MKQVAIFGLLLLAVGCAMTEEQRHAMRQASETAAAAAPFLPPPFGLIAGGVATLLSGAAAVGANKVSNEKFRKKEKPSWLVRLWTDHSSTILASVLPIVTALRASGVLHFSDGELTMLATTLGTPVATKKVMRR